MWYHKPKQQNRSKDEPSTTNNGAIPTSHQHVPQLVLGLAHWHGLPLLRDPTDARLLTTYRCPAAYDISFGSSELSDCL